MVDLVDVKSHLPQLTLETGFRTFIPEYVEEDDFLLCFLSDADMLLVNLFNVHQ